MSPTTPRRRRSLLLIPLLALALAFPKLPGASADGPTLAPAGQSLAMEINEGQLVRLERPASSVFVANPEVADVSVKSARLVYVLARKAGETTLYAVDEAEAIIANMRIVVSHNLSRLNAALAQLLPGSPVNAISIDGGIVLSGTVANAVASENAQRLAARFIAEPEEVINQIAVASSNQVNLRVRIAEVSRDVIKQFGINWEAAFDGSILFGIATGNPVITSSLAGFGTISPRSGSFLTRRGNDTSSAFTNISPGNLDLNVLIDALAESNLITVLAEPNLTALSGETASFLAGGEFPVPVAQGDNSVTIEFKKFGVSLAFTPTMLSDNRISLRVRPEVSQITSTGAITTLDFVIPALTTRRAETTVELASGQSFAIAGLQMNRSLQDAQKVPGLGDIPVLGKLFQSDRFERNETELVIIATPYVVRPYNGRMPLPTDPYVTTVPTPTEGGLANTGASPQTVPFGNGTAPGRAGFIVE